MIFSLNFVVYPVIKAQDMFNLVDRMCCGLEKMHSKFRRTISSFPGTKYDPKTVLKRYRKYGPPKIASLNPGLQARLHCQREAGTAFAVDQSISDLYDRLRG